MANIDNLEAEEHWEALKTIVLDVAMNIVGKKKKRRAEWYDDECKKTYKKETKHLGDTWKGEPEKEE